MLIRSGGGWVSQSTFPTSVALPVLRVNMLYSDPRAWLGLTLSERGASPDGHLSAPSVLCTEPTSVAKIHFLEKAGKECIEYAWNLGPSLKMIKSFQNQILLNHVSLFWPNQCRFGFAITYNVACIISGTLKYDMCTLENCSCSSLFI